MRLNRRALITPMLAIVLFAGACGSNDDNDTGDTGSDKANITVGVSGAFAESQIIAEMYAQLLEKAGYEVDRQLNLESREISQPAIESGEIDIKPEYLSSMLLYLDKNAAASADPDEVEKALKPLVEAKDVTLLGRMEANDVNSLVVTKATADNRKLEKVSDLASVAGQMILGGPAECPERPLCVLGYKEKYGITFKEFKALDSGGPQTVAALEGNEIQVGLLFSTSGAIQKKNFVVLEDDKGLQPAENIVPLVRTDVLNDEIRELLESVKLDTKTITELNAKVDIDNEDPPDVAREYLEDQGLL